MAITTSLPILRLGSIDLRDQGSFAIVDLSTYATTPTSSVLQVTPPGWPRIGVPFTPGTVNVYKCGDFNITCALVNCCPLPDGIYAVTLTVTFPGQTPTSIDQSFIKVDQLDCRITNLFLKVDLDCDCETQDQKKYKAQIKDIELLRDGAVAAANNCDDLLAYKLYLQADKYIDRVYAKFCSTCTPIPSCDKCN